MTYLAMLSIQIAMVNKKKMEKPKHMIEFKGNSEYI